MRKASGMGGGAKQSAGRMGSVVAGLRFEARLETIHWFESKQGDSPMFKYSLNTMNVTSLAQMAGLIGEAGRIQMLTTLLDGNGHSASELAIAAAVSPQTASSHLAKLLSGGLVVSEPSGRQRLFRLKNADVAVAIEALGALAHNPGASALPEMRFARACYDHPCRRTCDSPPK